jgi:MFS family permease
MASEHGRPAPAVGTNQRDPPAVHRPPHRRAVRLVLLESTLWAAGNAVTTGAFLMYFARDLGAAGAMIGIIAAVPETSGILRLLAPALIARLGNRKRTVIAASLAARVLSLGIPCIAVTRLSVPGIDPLFLFVSFLFAAQACQWIAYVAYISWLSDLVPRQRWGRFFAARNVCTLLVVLVVPILAGAVRDRWIDHPAAILWAYAVPFVIGVLLMAVSLVPLSLLPHGRAEHRSRPAATLAAFTAALADRSFRRLIVYSGWLALWSGLAQAPFYVFVKSQLGIGLAALSAGFTLMHLVQLPVSIAAGRLADRIGDRPVLGAALAAVAASMLFLLPATPGRWWLVYGTFACWGAWAAVNICQQNLMLAHAPRSHNTAHIALFQAAGGLTAGLSGIAGGWLLDRLIDANFLFSCGSWQCGPFALLFVLSGIGRALAIAWLPRAGGHERLSVREPSGVRGGVFDDA